MTTTGRAQHRPAAARRRRRRTAALLAVLVAFLVAGLLVPRWLDHLAAARYPVPAAELAAARSALPLLPTAGAPPVTDYQREAFGQRWADVDRNGCDTRNDVLARDLTDVVHRPGTDGCVVASGRLTDPYSGTVIDFERGERSAEVQIDHVVALADAWRNGAHRWTPAQRVAFANDPVNLLAVDGTLNADKGAADASAWLPPNTGYRCAYVIRQVTVKATYDLAVTAAEREAMAEGLDRCVVADPSP